MITNNHLKKKIINLDTGKVYNSMTDAANDVQCAKMSLSNAINKQRKCKGYYWAFLNDVQTSGLTVDQYRQKLVNDIEQKHNKIGYREQSARLVINLNTGETFNTAIEACRKYNLSESMVGYACKSHQKAGDYYWGYANDVPDEQTRLALLEQYTRQKIDSRQYAQQSATNSIKKPVVNLNTGEVFESCSAAKRSIGLNTNIQQAINKHCKAGGYYWAYKEDVDRFGIEPLLNKLTNK